MILILLLSSEVFIAAELVQSVFQVKVRTLASEELRRHTHQVFVRDVLIDFDEAGSLHDQGVFGLKVTYIVLGFPEGTRSFECRFFLLG